LPLSSVTVHTTVVFPSPYGSTELFVTDPTPQLSDVILVPRATLLAVHIPESVSTTTSAGQVIVGTSLSVCISVVDWCELTAINCDQ
jgi:hypothetical protein